MLYHTHKGEGLRIYSILIVQRNKPAVDGVIAAGDKTRFVRA
jgi:hypothetical protein